MVRKIITYVGSFILAIAVFFPLLSVLTRLTYHTGPARPQNVQATPFVQKDIVVQGLRLRYIDEGRGQTVVLLPGHTSRIEEYDEITKILRQNFRVLALDFPGSGYSDKPDREYSLVFYEDILLGFLDALQVDKCYLFGSSLGGNLTLRLAHRAPTRFPRIVVGAPGSAWPAKPGLAGVMRVFGGPAIFWPTVRIQSSYWYRAGLPGREAKKEQAFAYYREIMSRGFIRMYWDMAADQIGRSLFDIVADIKTPALLMWGSQDRGWEMDQGVLRISKAMPHAELKVLNGVGHAIATEDPWQVAAAIAEFFSRPVQKLP